MIWQSSGRVLFDSYLYAGCICYYSVCRKKLLPVLLETVKEDKRKTFLQKAAFSVSCSLQKTEIATLEYFYSGGKCQFYSIISQTLIWNVCWLNFFCVFKLLWCFYFLPLTFVCYCKAKLKNWDLLLNVWCVSAVGALCSLPTGTSKPWSLQSNLGYF